MIKKLNYFFQAFIIYLIFFIGRILGIKISRKLFSHIFYLIGPIFKSKKIIISNIKIFSKNISDAEIKGITDSMWRNYGKKFIEYIFLDYFRKNNNHIEIIGLNNISEQIEGGKPVIFVSGHFANFELMSMEITKKNINLATIYRPLNNFFLNPFMEYLRKKYICRNQIKKGLPGVKEAIQYIKDNFSVALMIDQRLSEGKRLPFFENMALTTTLPAQLALKFNLDIVPIYILRDDKNNFIIEVDKPIKINKNDKSEENKLNISIKLNSVLEKMISEDPGQWIWTHNRWK